MAALQYMHIPGYAALILRKDTQRLALAGGVIPRSFAWLANSGAKWNGTRRQWSFETTGAPATLTFGYLAHPLDKFRYASSEFQYLAFDELTELAEADYLFLFSRLRKPKEMNVSLRVRSASNPGNVGHLWVKQRFISDEAIAAASSGDTSTKLFLHHGRAYIPSRIADNQALDENEYRATLAHLPPLERERLMNGDWSVQEQGLFRPDWLRYYTETAPDPLDPDNQLELLAPDHCILAIVKPRNCKRFVTVDPAGTSADKQRELRGHQRSWSVAQVWEQPRRREHSRFLILRHQVRKQVDFADLCKMLRQLCEKWKPEKVCIENEKLGFAAVSVLKEDFPIETIATEGKEKVCRAAHLINRFEKGQVFLPKFENSWRPEFEAELLSWTGLKEQQSDQIDAAAYAAIHAQHTTPDVITITSLFERE